MASIIRWCHHHIIPSSRHHLIPSSHHRISGRHICFENGLLTQPTKDFFGGANNKLAFFDPPTGAYRIFWFQLFLASSAASQTPSQLPDPSAPQIVDFPIRNRTFLTYTKVKKRCQNYIIHHDLYRFLGFRFRDESWDCHRICHTFCHRLSIDFP